MEEMESPVFPESPTFPLCVRETRITEKEPILEVAVEPELELKPELTVPPRRLWCSFKFSEGGEVVTVAEEGTEVDVESESDATVSRDDARRGSGNFFSGESSTPRCMCEKAMGV